jgi:hypothetical protein
MKRTLIVVFLLALLGLSCSELKQDLPSNPAAPGTHQAGWDNPSSAGFHGTVLKASNFDATSCQRCHAKDFSGGTAQVSCTKCHATYPHPTGWTTKGDAQFHGSALKANAYADTACQHCHGVKLDGGTSGVSCATCHSSYPHQAGWQTPGSATFHGAALKAVNYNAAACQSCHGSDFAGGTSGVACATCHANYPHPAGWATPGGNTSHGVALKSASWADASCQACHGSNYQGGTSGTSCFTCHPAYPHSASFATGGHQSYIVAKGYAFDECKTCHGPAYSGGTIVTTGCMTSGCHVDQTGTAKSPEACNTCHGNFPSPASVTASFAPPKALNGDTQETSTKVGAHQKHLLGAYGKAVVCAECHVVPAGVASPGHLGSSPAEVVFNGPLGTLVTGNGSNVPAPSYASNSCGSTYCHGNWTLRKSDVPALIQFVYTDTVMTGAKASPAWNAGSTAGQCTSCHGDGSGSAVPRGHIAFAINACVNCHGDVVNDAGTIVNKAKHVNGNADLIPEYGTQLPMK